MKIVLIADTHGLHNKLNIPDGELLIHAGDFTRINTYEDIKIIDNWFGSLPHKHKILIAGNHDMYLEAVGKKGKDLFKNVTYLLDEEIIIENVKLYGSPWQPEFMNWGFNLPRGQALKEKWNLIPLDTDILITHGPPYEILDYTIRDGPVGCEELYKAVKRVKPKVHVFGHIHESYGIEKKDGITFVNASMCSFNYNNVNSPIVIDI